MPADGAPAILKIFADDIWGEIVNTLFNIVVPLTFNDETNVHGPLKLGIVGGFKIEL